MSLPLGKRHIEEQLAALLDIRRAALALERQQAADIAAAAPAYRASARNLLHYLALRQHDIRPMQQDLAQRGLSSLGRTEAHTLAGIDAVLAALCRLVNRPLPAAARTKPPVSFHSGPARLARHTAQLLGRPPPGRTVRIMVTMPTEAATNGDLVRDLVAAGMDVMRINCAHDDPQVWGAMVENLKRVRRDRPHAQCRVLLDLAGPKLRTGPLAQGPEAINWHPRRDPRGQLVAPARIWLRPPESNLPAPVQADGVLPVPAVFLAETRQGDELRLQDCRGKFVRLRVVATVGACRWAACPFTAYVATGATLQLWRQDALAAATQVGPLPAFIEPLVLHVGDRLLVTADQQPGRRAIRNPDGTVFEPARIPCLLPEVFPDLHAGQRIHFDDGKIGAVIRRATAAFAEVEITHTGPRGGKLLPDRGINLPDSELSLTGLTARDLADLDFGARHADIVSLSFVRTPADVARLEDELAARHAGHPGILLKIETRAAFENLPRLLLTGLRSPPVGIMVARGDLGVEVGFERLAEVQEEILWLCEAAHVPAIWATQVLESLAKKGVPSRAEVTDAAMSCRAECVMLNKGPYVVDAVRFLDGVLRRMQVHQHKKRTMLRQLSVSKLT